MKVEELSYSSVVYKVTEDKIEKVVIRNIRKLDEKVDGKSKFRINEDRYGDGYECLEGDTKAYFKKSTSVCLWFDIEEARLEQAIKREQVISEAHKRAQIALSFYNDVVLKYLNAPISNPE